MTSLDHKDFWKFIAQAEKNGLTHMVIEVSSHALYQSRIRPIKFSAVGFTNLTREHLDFHRTMEHYALTKSQLFAEVLP
ncbi:MAG: UDP-N-acetylmuramoylalanyl-D-glutamate--2,6-diaminopimelate ligase [Candidatus Parcubacteria bacterium]